MKAAFEELIQLENEYSSCSKNQFDNNENEVTRKNVKSVLKERNKQLQDIGFQVSEILNEYVYPYTKNPSLINESIAIELEELAENLSGYTSKIDTGLAYEIRSAIVEYALIIKDEELYIRNLFFKGLCLFFLSKKLFHKEMHECYTKIIEFAPKYETFSEATRNIIIRAFGNCYVSVVSDDTDSFFKYINKAKEFWKNTGEKVDPQFRWNAFYANIDENICSMGATALRDLCSAGKELNQNYIDNLYESSQKIYNDFQNKNTSFYTYDEFKMEYYYYTGMYYKNIISREELCEELYKLYKKANNDNYTERDVFANLQIPALYFFYSSKLEDSNKIKEVKDSKVVEIEKSVLTYIKNIPISIPKSRVTSLISNFATGMYEISDSFEFLRIVLDLTVFRHKPTYAHSVVTAKIASVIMKYLIDNKPEYLIGVKGINSVEDVKEYAVNLEAFAWFAALSHDVGKITYTDMVSIYVRKLNDLEFEIIKQHPHSEITEAYMGKYKEKKVSAENDFDKEKSKFRFISNQNAIKGVVEVAYGHHKSYNNEFGYPKECDNSKSEFKKIIDIVTICDCIDAATDNIGRSYAKGKSLEKLVSELKAGAGRNYSPFIADLILEDNILFYKIEDIIMQYRYDVYYTCFFEDETSFKMFDNYNI